MADAFIQAAIKSAGLEVGVATTTETCRDAQKAHGLSITPSIALGRLLTAAALVALTSKRKDITSFQIITPSRLKQIFVDATPGGDVRGFVRNTTLSLPTSSLAEKRGRRELSVALLPGKLHVVRAEGDGVFHQGTVNLFAGECDLDIEYFFEKSDQVPTALACEVLIDDEDRLEVAGGLIVQALPNADLDRLNTIREHLHSSAAVEAVRAHAGDAAGLLAALLPDAVILEAPRTVRWKCRCSKERVISALSMLHPSELASMCDEPDPQKITCDMCSHVYEVPPGEIEQIFFATIKAQG